jgi:hypothetical protein
LIKDGGEPFDRLGAYYLNLAKMFVAGAVYGPVKKEVVVGARVTLTEMDGSKASYIDMTDNFRRFRN